MTTTRKPAKETPARDAAFFAAAAEAVAANSTSNPARATAAKTSPREVEKARVGALVQKPTALEWATKTIKGVEVTHAVRGRWQYRVAQGDGGAWHVARGAGLRHGEQLDNGGWCL